jgi:hypothetical protein
MVKKIRRTAPRRGKDPLFSDNPLLLTNSNKANLLNNSKACKQNIIYIIITFIIPLYFLNFSQIKTIRTRDTFKMYILSSHKRGASRWVLTGTNRITSNSLFKSQQPVPAFRTKKSWRLFLMWITLPKTYKGVVTSRYSPCADTPSAATTSVAKKGYSTTNVL